MGHILLLSLQSVETKSSFQLGIPAKWLCIMKLATQLRCHIVAAIMSIFLALWLFKPTKSIAAGFLMDKWRFRERKKVKITDCFIHKDLNILKWFSLVHFAIFLCVFYFCSSASFLLLLVGKTHTMCVHVKKS